MKTISMLAALSIVSFSSSITVRDMDIRWTEEADCWSFELSAPTTGWVALGFNQKNDIVHTNLIMTAVRQGAVSSEDFYVVGFGNPQPITKLGGSRAISELEGEEKNGHTTVRFSIPKKANDQYHYDLKAGDEIWLICAYSRADEFDHHSMMRQHVKVRL